MVEMHEKGKIHFYFKLFSSIVEQVKISPCVGFSQADTHIGSQHYLHFAENHQKIRCL